MTKSKSDEFSKVKWTLLNEFKPKCVDILFDYYSVDKAKARIYYHLNRGGLLFVVYRHLIFEKPDGYFRVVLIRKTYGISVNGKMYSSEKTMKSITYSKNGFHYFNNQNRTSYIRQLDYNLFHNYIYGDGQLDTSLESIKSFFYERFGWLRNVSESSFWNIPFNVIVKRKLFNNKAILRHIYGCPYPQAKIIHAYCINSRGGFKFIKVWTEMKKSLINVESLTSEMFNNRIFIDSCNMATMVGSKVNCSWGYNRLRVEHDKWTKLVTEVILDTQEFKLLNIGLVFKEFAEYSGFELLLSNHDLLAEGQRMLHCVGTYSSKVDMGSCGIYRVDGYTLELGISLANKLQILQFMNFGNTAVPIESVNKVNDKINSFEPSMFCGLENREMIDLPF